MFNLTPEERRVILFLAATIFFGTGINFCAKNYLPIKTFIYSGQDLVKVDLNTANKDLLMKVPGIGLKLAGRIIAYRQNRDGFNALEELKDIPGVTDAQYVKIKEYLRVKE